MISFKYKVSNLFHRISKRKLVNIQSNVNVDRKILLLNKYSILLHIILSGMLCLIIECISRRSFISALSFANNHTKAFIYNSFIIFTSLSLVYLLRRRMLARILIGGFWIFLGTINGCILSKRVTPFGYTDLECIRDLMEMENTKYFTVQEAVLVVSVVVVFLLFCLWLFVKGPKFRGKRHYVLTPILIAGLFLMLPVTTKAAQKSNILDSYFSNIAQGYENYGFVYGFSTSVVDRGMKKPADYTEEQVNNILNNVTVGETENTEDPNIIVVLLESFCDPSEINFLQCSQDPVPNFHSLEENYSSGYLTVPVVGAGTANTEFEVLTGMSLQFFGTGEYPYKTILKETDCESIASDLSKIGYGTHAVHNNGGNFYSRVNAFSMMGFDTFTSKELMNIQEYTPLGDWPTDNILVNETKKALDSTPSQSDFVYTITVQGHGTYPEEKIIENPEVTVTGAEDESSQNQWEYYVNEIHEVDKFIGNLTAMLEARDEKSIVVFFGDHLPTMGLEDSDMKSGDIFKTKYVTWNNFGMEKEDADVTAYELLANITNQMDIHEGTVFTYEQDALNKNQTDTESFTTGLDDLQYDILYGKRYAYDGEDLYPASDLVMGVEDVDADSAWLSGDDAVVIAGDNFTKWSKVYVNGKKVLTSFISDERLQISADSIKDGDTIVVNQVGSENTIFRSSNELIYGDTAVADEPVTDGIVSNE